METFPQLFSKTEDVNWVYVEKDLAKFYPINPFPPVDASVADSPFATIKRWQYFKLYPFPS